MPVYEYLCEKCEHEFEREQRISDDPVKTCPACRSRKVKRLISRTSFVLKGSGWYSDLYSSPSGDKGDKDKGDKDKGDKKDAKTGSEGSTSDATSETKSDAAKSDAKPDKSKKKPGKGKSKSAA